MNRISLKVEGIPALRRMLLRLSDEGKRGAVRAVKKSALTVRSRAKRNAPKASGDLSRSIRLKASRSGLTSRIGTDDPKAHLVEFGTVRSAAKPFLFPAVEEERLPYQANLRGELNEALSRTVKGK